MTAGSLRVGVERGRILSQLNTFPYGFIVE
ncbi:hypothetical protein Pan161_07050 [Gimesia algae]|uniref:Uncharacterized protein n=1 Tax=Gimesia algae TaxID=2527971 RepID=A0A517V7U9_9PLAN|nr:hypothetical protein Pan161_07050 [Gimesia algae]